MYKYTPVSQPRPGWTRWDFHPLGWTPVGFSPTGLDPGGIFTHWGLPGENQSATGAVRQGCLSHADFSYIILPSISVFEIRTNTKGYKSFFFRKVLVCLQKPIWTIICPYVTSVVQTFLSKMYHF